MAKYEKIFSISAPKDKKEFYETLINKYVDRPVALKFDTIVITYLIHEDDTISVNFVVEYTKQDLYETESFIDGESFKSLPIHLEDEKYHNAIVDLVLASLAYNQMMKMLKSGFENLYLLDKKHLDKQKEFIENKNEFIVVMEKLINTIITASNEIHMKNT